MKFVSHFRLQVGSATYKLKKLIFGATQESLYTSRHVDDCLRMAAMCIKLKKLCQQWQRL